MRAVPAGAAEEEMALKWLTDRRDARVVASLAWSCDICKARVQHWCTNTIEPGKPLAGRVVHIGRLVRRTNG